MGNEITHDDVNALNRDTYIRRIADFAIYCDNREEVRRAGIRRGGIGVGTTGRCGGSRQALSRRGENEGVQTERRRTMNESIKASTEAMYALSSCPIAKLAQRYIDTTRDTQGYAGIGIGA